MTTDGTRELIAEARGKQCGCSGDYCDAGLVRRLADALEAATRERDAALAAVERVREIHSPGRIIDVWGKSVSQADDFLVCEECTDPDNNWCPWPCETIQALDGAPEPELEREYRRVRPDGVPVFNAVFESLPVLDDYYTAEYRTVSQWHPVEGEKPRVNTRTSTSVGKKRKLNT